MFNQVKSIYLQNFQSWNDKSGCMNMETDVINVIRGRNEIGKSVIFKVLYEMCFPGYHGSVDLVRRGCDYGAMVIVLENGTQLMFQLFAKGGRAFYMQRLNETDSKIWKQTELPHEFEEELGLIVSYENRIILNVIDKDIPMPFIKTDPHYNAQVFRSVLEPEKLTAFFMRAKEYMIELRDAQAVFRRRADYFDAKQSAYDYVDVVSLGIKHRQLTSILPSYKDIIELQNAVVDTYNIAQTKPEPFTVDIEQAEVYMRILTALNQGIDTICSLSDLEQTPPTCNEAQLSRSLYLLKFNRALSSLSSEVVSLAQSTPSPSKPIPAVVPELFKLSSMVSTCQGQLCDCLQLQSELHDVIDVTGTPTVLLGALKSVSNISWQLGTYSRIRADAKHNLDTIEHLEAGIQQLQDELGVCPTCGRSFHEQGIHIT